MDKFLVSKKLPVPSQNSQPEKTSKVNGAQSFSSVGQLKASEYSCTTVEELLASNEYDPKNPPFFSTKENRVPFFFLAESLNYVSSCKGQNSADMKKEALKNLFITFLYHEKESLSKVFLFLSIRIGNDWSKKVTGVGVESLKKVIKIVTGLSSSSINEKVAEFGDLGLVFEKSKCGQGTIQSFFGGAKKSSLKLPFESVFEALSKLTQISGTSSQEEKEAILVELFRLLSPAEGKFVSRFILGNLGIGAAEKIQLISLSRAFCEFFAENDWEIGDINEVRGEALCNLPLEDQLAMIKKGPKVVEESSKSLKKLTVKKAREPSPEEFKFWENAITKIITEFPDHAKMIDSLLEKKSLPIVRQLCRIHPLVPCKPMLAKPTKAITAIFDRLENRKFTCEFKYDGLRGQVHWAQGQLKIYSRNLDELTESYPDVAEALQPLTAVCESFIIDSEIVGWDRASDRILPFQKLTSRAKKNVDVANEVQVCLFIFDCLYLNGVSLLPFSLAARRAVLSNVIPENAPAAIKLATHSNCEEVAQIEEFLNESVAKGCEGLMVKLLEEESSYEPAKRTFKWLKLKKDYIEKEGIGDSLDLVVIGANRGEGKRAGKYGSFLVASFNHDLMIYEACCLVGTGLSDLQLAEFKEKFDKLVVNTMPEEYVMEKNAMAQIWFKPEVVWEIKAADIQQSPVYLCGKNYVGERGLGLRFPRFIRPRDDKGPENASTSKFIATLYKSQETVALEDDDDYY